MIHSIAFVLSMFFATAAWAGTATPPAQPTNGPGGFQYAYSGVAVHEYDSGAQQYWIFEPSTIDKPLPVIAFLHGWGARNPQTYGAWIEHLVKRGNIVIYPRYQLNLRTPTTEMTANAMGALKSAFALLKPRTTQVDTTQFAVVGHSLGALMAANVGVLATSYALPMPKAIMSIEPGRTWNPSRRANIELEDLSKIPAATWLVVMVGDRDRLTGDRDAKRIFMESTSLPAEHKRFILVNSDEHGTPPLLASHFAPSCPDSQFYMQTSEEDAVRGAVRDMSTVLDIYVDHKMNLSDKPFPDTAAENIARGRTDSLDYYAYWKTFDILTQSVFAGRTPFAPELRMEYMGAWSDGVPVTALKIMQQVY